MHVTRPHQLSRIFKFEKWYGEGKDIIFRPSIPLIFLCAGAANKELRHRQQMAVHHSASSWRMDIVFVAEFRSDTATLRCCVLKSSAFQGGLLPTPCSCAPGLHGSPYISVALRVQPRFDPHLGISSDVEEFPLA